MAGLGHLLGEIVGVERICGQRQVRARLLGTLQRHEEAQRTIRVGLQAARDYRLPYEEAMLLMARIELAEMAGETPDPLDVETSRTLLGDLGVELTPRPPGQTAN